VTLPNQTMALIMPAECEESPRASALVERLLNDKNKIERAEYIDLRQSMHNGGGPACLRLRVVLNERELHSVNPRYLMDERKIGQLETWVNKHYRDRLTVNDFLDREFRDSCTQAMHELNELI
jgi:succinylarginine dihydrolase